MLISLLLLAAAATPAQTDPLAPARAGKIQCVGPNQEKKTCLAFGRYQVDADGSYQSTVTVLVNPSPAITMETRAKGKVENGQVCGIIRKEDYAASTFTLDGAPMDAAMADGIKAQVLAVVSTMDGKNGCSSERADGDVLVSEVTLDGVARPELTQRFIWISPDEGYKLGTP